MITWLASYPKSGNTWLRLLLSTYKTGSCDINDIQGSLLDYQPHFYKSLLIDDDKPVDVLHIRTAALYHLNKFFIHPYLKTHWGNYEVMGIKAIPPALTSKAVVMVRDPRDLVFSLAHFYRQSIDEVIEILNNSKAGTFEEDKYYYLGSWSDYHRSWKKAPFPVIFVRYEDLKANTPHHWGIVLNFLELPRQRLKTCDRLTQFDRLHAQEAARGFVEQKNGTSFFHQGGYDWRLALNPEQRRAIEAAHHKEMVAFGYLTSEEASQYD